MSGKFDLKDYVDVKERIRQFYAAYPDGRLVTDIALGSTEPDDKPRVWVKALAYRTPDDPHPGTGWSWLELPGSTPYTKNSELENAETSAWGRAIGCLGIGIAAGIASRDEVQSKSAPAIAADATEDAKALAPAPEFGPLDDLIGTVEERKPPADLNLRQTPDGYAYGFGLVAGGRGGRIQVIATGQLAQDINDAGLAVDERVKVFGKVELVEWTPAGGKAVRTYQRLHLERITTADWTLPELVEAPSIPLFPEDAA